MRILLLLTVILILSSCSKKKAKIEIGIVEEPAKIVVKAQNPLKSFGVDTFKEIEESPIRAIPERHTVLFELNSDALSNEAVEIINDYVNYLGNSKRCMITLKGGACPLGTEGYNYNLAYRRAESVSRVFKEKGINCEIVEKSVGEHQLISDIPERYYLNRRCEIGIIE